MKAVSLSLILSLIIFETNALFTPHSLIIFETRHADKKKRASSRTSVFFEIGLLTNIHSTNGCPQSFYPFFNILHWLRCKVETKPFPAAYTIGKEKVAGRK